MPRNCLTAFTLSELLISLAILGVIATFTIPKVLQSQQDGKYKAITKEAVATISEAYQLYKLNNTVTGSTGISNMTSYLNYVQRDTTRLVDNKYNSATVDIDCAVFKCYQLHNGAMLMHLNSWGSFGGTASTNGLLFLIDPDGKVTDGTTQGPGKAVEFILFTNGQITGHFDSFPNGVSGGGAFTPDPGSQPPWFSWN